MPRSVKTRRTRLKNRIKNLGKAEEEYPEARKALNKHFREQVNKLGKELQPTEKSIRRAVELEIGNAKRADEGRKPSDAEVLGKVLKFIEENQVYEYEEPRSSNVSLAESR